MLLHFRIQLAHITKPPVWRKVVVPAQLSFLDFHHVIQAAFGWHNAHLFQFSESGFGSPLSYTIPDPDGFFDDDEEAQIDAAAARLSDVFRTEGQKHVYIYDFGDGWTHNITLEKISPDGDTKPALIDGKGACPPEDCGGPWGYEGLKEAVNDPKHPESGELREWLDLAEGESWDPAAFDLEAAQKTIDILFRN